MCCVQCSSLCTYKIVKPCLSRLFTKAFLRDAHCFPSARARKELVEVVGYMDARHQQRKASWS